MLRPLRLRFAGDAKGEEAGVVVKKADCVEADAEVVDVVVMALLVVADSSDSSDSSSAFRLRVLGFFAGGDAGADADDADRRDGAMALTEGDAAIVELRLIPVSVAVAVDEHGGVLLLLLLLLLETNMKSFSCRRPRKLGSLGGSAAPASSPVPSLTMM